MVTSDQNHCARLAYQKARELGYDRIGYVSAIGFENNIQGPFRVARGEAKHAVLVRAGPSRT